MTLDELQRENAYLKLRNAQLQSDVTDVTAERDRLAQELERVQGRRQARAASPLGDDR
jgi:FtsZ-binding cell division protein ZapB